MVGNCTRPSAGFTVPRTFGARRAELASVALMPFERLTPMTLPWELTMIWERSEPAVVACLRSEWYAYSLRAAWWLLASRRGE